MLADVSGARRSAESRSPIFAGQKSGWGGIVDFGRVVVGGRAAENGRGYM